MAKSGNIGIKGLDNLLANLNKEILQIRNRTLKGLINVTIDIRRDMDNLPPKIPIDVGNLRSSWFVVTFKGNTVKGGSAKFEGKNASKMESLHSQTIAEQQGIAKSMGSNKIPVVIMGFSANYAAPVHEMPESNNFQRPGSGPKYFEQHLDKEKILKTIAENIQIK